MPEARAYLGDGRLELDNNICERSIRPVAPGRKNCLFPGSVGGGEAAAIAYALIETAEMNNVDPEAWLTWVLERVADHGLTPSTNLCRGTGSPKTSKTRPDRTDTREVIAPVVDEDIVLVTDGHRACPRCAAAIGAHHEALNLSRRERVRGAFHIQIAADPAVNNRHGRLKDFLRRYRGVATRYLDSYLRWFQRLELENASPRACLATAIARPCIQFVN